MKIIVNAPNVSRIQIYSLELFLKKWAKEITYITTIEIKIKGSFATKYAREKAEREKDNEST